MFGGLIAIFDAPQVSESLVLGGNYCHSLCWEYNRHLGTSVYPTGEQMLAFVGRGGGVENVDCLPKAMGSECLQKQPLEENTLGLFCCVVHLHYKCDPDL